MIGADAHRSDIVAELIDVARARRTWQGSKPLPLGTGRASHKRPRRPAALLRADALHEEVRAPTPDAKPWLRVIERVRTLGTFRHLQAADELVSQLGRGGLTSWNVAQRKRVVSPAEICELVPDEAEIVRQKRQQYQRTVAISASRIVLLAAGTSAIVTGEPDDPATLRVSARLYGRTGP